MTKLNPISLNPTFKRIGKNWEIIYRGKRVLVTHTEGLAQYNYLIKKQSASVIDLAKLADKEGETNPVYSKIPTFQSEERVGEAERRPIGETLKTQGLSLVSFKDGLDCTDQRTISDLLRRSGQIKKDLKSINDEIEDAEFNGDFYKASKLKERKLICENDFIDRYLKENTYGKGSNLRPRYTGSTLETLRKRVFKTLETARKNLKKLHPPFYKHLKNNIHYQKYSYTYQPEEKIAWQL